MIEITEQESIHDYRRFEDLVSHYTRQGFRIALDDFGSGHSSLVTLVRCVPPLYKQQLVKALVAFSTSVDAKLIAEGVETREELETLLRLGVRYGQGFLFARPAPEPAGLQPAVREELVRLVRAAETLGPEYEESLRGLIAPCVTIEAGTLHVDDLDHLFRHRPAADHVVVLRAGKPAGLVTRISFHAKTGGPFGYPVFQRKAAEAVAKSHPLVVPQETRITSLYNLAMSRLPEDLYDPVLVVDAQGWRCSGPRAPIR